MTLQDPDETKIRQALAAWAAYPADRDPRPAVLLDTTPAVRPTGPFPSQQEKLAFFHGAVEALPGFPGPVLQAMRSQQPDHYDGPPLLLTSAILASAPYETGRGPAVLPTWEVHAQDVAQPIRVLDPALRRREQVWEPPGRTRVTGRRPQAALAADGRTLIMMLTGSPHADSNQPPASTHELGQAVVMAFREKLKPRPPAPVLPVALVRVR